MQTFLIVLFTVSTTLSFIPTRSHASPTAAEIMAIAQQQLAAPAEAAQGEMRIYRHDTLSRTYDFVLGRSWAESSQTENVRVDFHSPVSLELGDSSGRTDNRYLLRRSAHTPPTQWLYLPALRRVRITPYRPAERVLSSHYFFYDLTWVLALSDLHYQFSANAQNAQEISIAGSPLSPLVPYRRVDLTLEQRGTTYLITTMTVIGISGDERMLKFADFHEVSPGYYRPRSAVWTNRDGRTELSYSHWVVGTLPVTVFSPAQLETQTLVVPK